MEIPSFNWQILITIPRKFPHKKELFQHPKLNVISILWFPFVSTLALLVPISTPREPPPYPQLYLRTCVHTQTRLEGKIDEIKSNDRMLGGGNGMEWELVINLIYCVADFDDYVLSSIF